MIKRTNDLARCSLPKMISHIKACELDDNQKETNHKNSMLAVAFSATPTTTNNNNDVLVSQSGFQMFSSSASSKAAPTSANSKENLDIAASFINCLNAFATGKLDPPRSSMDDLHQIHPDDVEEMDITWQMAMAAFRAKNFVKRTGRNKWDGLTFTGPTKMSFELRCYNCHEPGHVARNCTKPRVNREQTLAQPAPPDPERALVTTTDISTAAGGSTQSSALVVQPNATFYWNAEIQRLNISAPENQTASEKIAFMTSASEDKNSAPKDEVPAKNLAHMTQILSAPVHGLTTEEVSSVFCTPECRGKVEAYRLHYDELIQDYNDMKRQNFSLKKNEKLYKEKIEAQRKDIA
ncbi:putative transcription factor interactor and regulator CCHC(Zn) family [Helianthus anomalus]